MSNSTSHIQEILARLGGELGTLHGHLDRLELNLGSGRFDLEGADLQLIDLTRQHLGQLAGFVTELSRTAAVTGSIPISALETLRPLNSLYERMSGHLVAAQAGTEIEIF